MSEGSLGLVGQQFVTEILAAIKGDRTFMPRAEVVVDLPRVKRVRDLWQQNTARETDEAKIATFEQCVRALSNDNVGRCELLLALGRPVEKEFQSFSVREFQRLPVTGGDSFDRAVLELMKEAESTHNIDDLRQILEDLQNLCGSDALSVLTIQRKLIVCLLGSVLGRNTDLMSEVQAYLERVSIDFLPDALLAEEKVKDHLVLINNAYRIVSAGLGADSATLQWCRNFLCGCIEVQNTALATPAFSPEYIHIREAQSKNKDCLNSLEKRLRVSTDTEQKLLLPPRLQHALQMLDPADPMAQLISTKQRKLHSGSEVESEHAADFLNSLAEHPRIRGLVSPESVRFQTIDTAEQRNARVAAIRAKWDEQVVGQDVLRDNILHRLGTLLETNGKGFTLRFMGPPGVGKSMVAKIIAEESDRELITIHGESLSKKGQLVGNEGMYIGTEPGLIASALLRCAKAPVILIDELGKADSEAQAALATILDRERNSSFTDVFLGNKAPFDLSQVIFIITANGGEDLDQSICNRTTRFNFVALKEEYKRQLVSRVWPKKAAEASLPATLLLSSKATDVVIRKRMDDPGVRQLLETDLTELADWAHSRKDDGRLPEKIDAAIVKRVVEQTWADVATYDEGRGFIADIRLGSFGLRRENKEGNAVFSALERLWEVRCVDGKIELFLRQGEPAGSYFSLRVLDAEEKTYAATTTGRQAISKTAGLCFDLSKALPSKHKEWLPLLEEATTLKLRVVGLLGERWMTPTALLKTGDELILQKTTRYTID